VQRCGRGAVRAAQEDSLQRVGAATRCAGTWRNRTPEGPAPSPGTSGAPMPAHRFARWYSFSWSAINRRKTRVDLGFGLAERPKSVRGAMAFFKHEQAIVETSFVGDGTTIWAFAHILPGARIGRDCNICDHTFIENDVVVGDRVTIKCSVQLWDGIAVEDDVFLGPNATFTNDPFPRSKRRPQEFRRTTIKRGASIGANATILPGLTVGEGAMIDAGAVLTHDAPPRDILVGNPARIKGYADVSAERPFHLAPVKCHILGSPPAAGMPGPSSGGVVRHAGGRRLLCGCCLFEPRLRCLLAGHGGIGDRHGAGRETGISVEGCLCGRCGARLTARRPPAWLLQNYRRALGSPANWLILHTQTNSTIFPSPATKLLLPGVWRTVVPTGRLERHSMT
jgi:acetyltransferase-like isoleucine patch superfamily enzyme